MRRENRCLSFAKKCLGTPLAHGRFPKNPVSIQNVRQNKKYKVNFAHTENYRNSSAPYCQGLLNKNNLMEEERRRMRREEARSREREEGATTQEREEAGTVRREGVF